MLLIALTIVVLHLRSEFRIRHLEKRISYIETRMGVKNEQH